MQSQDKILNPEQIKAIKHGDGPLLIIAGAGTGKTTVITERIKRFITKELALPGEILALTFTEKASREMEERVDIAMPYGYTQMWISTFHSFCDRILRLEALHIGLSPAYKLMTETESLLFFRKNLFKFNLEYFRPLGNPHKFITGILQHFSKLHDEDISPEEYLEWIKSRIKNQELKNKEGIKTTPRHSGEDSPKGEDDSRIKKKDSGRAPALPAGRSLTRTTDDTEEELKKYLELAHAYQKYEDLKIKESYMDFSDLISNTLKLFRTRKAVLKQYQDLFKYILVDEYQDTNIAQNELVKLLAGEKQNLTVVADDDQSIYKWRGASVSNVIQFKKSFPKVKLIVLNKNYRSTQEILNRSYDLIQNNNPDRLEVKEKINKKLVSERRIRGEKIEFAHLDRIENEADFTAKKIIELISRHSGEDTEGGRLQNQDAKDSGRAHSSLARMTDAYDYKDFAILVRANSHAEPFTRSLSRHGIPFQFLGPGMLFKQPEVKDLIAYLKVLYNFEDSVSLYRVLNMEHFAISPRDIAALLNLTRKLNLSLFEACEKIVSQKEVVQKDIFQNDIRQYGNHNGFVLPEIGEDSRDKIKNIVGMINRHLKLITKETTGQLLYYFLEDTGILQKFTDYQNTKDEKTAQNISKFFDKLKSYEIDHEDAGIQTVVDWIDLALEMGESPRATDTDWTVNNAVNILTVHSAKGLEFPVVFLVNLVSQRFPTTEKKESIPIPEDLIKEILPQGDSHLEEERRLFYVGLTRARDLLYLTAADYYGEGKREKKISPFVKETIGENDFQNNSKIAQNPQLSLLGWKKIEEMALPKTKIPVNFLSFSQINTFKTCPLQYKYRYLLRIPVPPGAAASFGDSMHKTLYSLYNNLQKGFVLTKEQLFLELERFWVPLGYSSIAHEEKMKNRGKEALEKFFKKAFNPQNRPLALEQKFTLPLTDKLKIRGKIDRIDDLGKGKIEIIDYKTGKVPTQKEIDKNLQIAVYALAATGRWIYNKKPEEVMLSFYFFETQEKITTERSEEDLTKVKEELIDTAKKIEESDFLPTPGLHCNFCDFRMICEAWN